MNINTDIIIKTIPLQYSINTMFIKIYIIDQCNYMCNYCYNNRPRSNKLINLLQLYIYIKKIYYIINNKIVLELIGGEPTLHPQLLDFCKKINNLHFIEKCILYTNGSADIKLYTILLNYNKISIDFSWHNSNTKYIQTICKLLKTCSIKQIENSTFSIMFEHNNISTALKIFNNLKIINHNLNIELLLVQKNKYYSLEYDVNDLNIYQQYLKSNKNKIVRCIDINNFYYDLTYPEINILNANHKLIFTGWKCYAGLNRLYIHIDGNIYPCQRAFENNEHYMFNIYEVLLNKDLLQTIICPYDTCGCEFFIQKEKIN